MAFVSACAIVVFWGMLGPLFGFSDSWQLVINTGTTIVTFLMVFLIQSTQTRDTESLQIKLDELIRVTEGAHNALLDLEELEDREFDAIRATYLQLARHAREVMKEGGRDTDRPEVD
jgi:low affinity Fe/Cu permease